jgi:hypothetical protein
MHLAPTPLDRLVDQKGRPYFLWDVEMTLDRFLALLRDPDSDVRAYALGKLMRQAKPDDVLALVTLDEVDAAWPTVERYLGKSRPFWAWLRQWWRARRASTCSGSDRSSSMTSRMTRGSCWNAKPSR